MPATWQGPESAWDARASSKPRLPEDKNPSCFIHHRISAPDAMAATPHMTVCLGARGRAAQLNSFPETPESPLGDVGSPGRRDQSLRPLFPMIRPTLEKSSEYRSPKNLDTLYSAEPGPFSQRIGAECPQRCWYSLSLENEKPSPEFVRVHC